MRPLSQLLITDLDGTLVVQPDFYRRVYSGTLNRLVEERRGQEGLRVLDGCRQKYEGRGELALFALNIPFRMWAKMLLEAPLDQIQFNLRLVELVRALPLAKVVFTGSPIGMATKLLERTGFAEGDFDLVMGWQEPEVFPVKWNSSPLVFRGILDRFQCPPELAWSLGDSWETDLMPAKALGMRSAKLGRKEGKADLWFESAEEFLQYLLEG